MAQDFKTTRTITEETIVEITAEQLAAILIGKFGGKDKKVDIWWGDGGGQPFGGATVSITKTNTHRLDDEELGDPLPVGEMGGSKVSKLLASMRNDPPFEHGTCFTDSDGNPRPHIFTKRSVSDMGPTCERCGEEPRDA